MPTPPHDDSPRTLLGWLSPAFTFALYAALAFAGLVLLAMMFPELWRG